MPESHAGWEHIHFVVRHFNSSATKPFSDLAQGDNKLTTTIDYGGSLYLKISEAQGVAVAMIQKALQNPPSNVSVLVDDENIWQMQWGDVQRDMLARYEREAVFLANNYPIGEPFLEFVRENIMPVVLPYIQARFQHT